MKKVFIFLLISVFLLSLVSAPVSVRQNEETVFGVDQNGTFSGYLDYYNMVTKRNTVGSLYLWGDNKTDDSLEFSIDTNTGYATIMKMISGIMQPASFTTGPNSLWVGVNVGVAGIGHHLATEAMDGHLHLHAHSEFDGVLTDSDAKIIYAYNYTERSVLQPDNSGAWEGTTFDAVIPSFSHNMQRGAYFQTDTTAATEPIRIQAWEGINDSGTLIFNQYYPSFYFNASVETRVVPEGYLEFDEGVNYMIRLSSSENFSLKTDSTGTFPWIAADTSLVREDALLQTQQWMNGTNFTDGQLLIYDRQIYVSNVRGVQTGTWESNSDKWDVVISSNVKGNMTVDGYLNVTGEWYGDGLDSRIDERTITQAVTGLLYGGRVSISSTNTSEIIISAGEGQVVDFSNPASATISRFTWDNISVGIECVPSTDCWILLNGSGSIIQQSDPSTPLQKRTHIDLARAWTANATTTVILGARNSQTYAFNGPKLAEDIGYTIGAVSIWGNGISANAENGSNLDKTEGEIFRMNYGAGTAPESPHIILSSAQSPIVANWYNFYGNLSNTTLFTVDYSDVGFNCDYYSEGGVKTLVPNNRYQIIDFYWWAYSEAPGPAFGTETYNTLANAISNRGTEDKAINRGYMTGATVLGSIACKEGEDWSTATFLAPIGGGGGSSGITAHSSLSQLEFDVSGHLFENGGSLDIGSYNFIVNRTTFYVNSSTGRIGIGTTAPTWPLHIFRNDDHAMLELEANGSNHGEANLYFETQSASSGWQIFMDDFSLNDLGDADRLGFYHGSSNTMVLDGNSGNVGIGTINPTQRLEVNGTINATRVDTSKIGNSGGILRLNPDATGTVELFGDADVLDDENGKMLYVWRRAPEGDDYIRFYIDSDRKPAIQADNELTLQAQQSLIINSVTDDIIFKVGDNAGAKKFYFNDSDGISVADIDSNGNAWFSGNVGIGMPSTFTALDVNGNAYMDGDLNVSGTFYGDGSQLTGISTGWSGYEIISVTTGSSSENKAQSAYCSSGKNVTGGGCSISDSNTNLAIQDSFPRSNGEWRCRGVETDAVAASWSLTVYAICGNI